MNKKFEKIFSVYNGNARGYGFSKVICIFGKTFVIPKLKYVGLKKILSSKESENELCKHINSTKPFILIRYGNSEINPVLTYLKSKNKKNIKFANNDINLLKNNAGFFSANTEEVTKFAKETIEIIKNADLLVPVMLNSRENKMTSLAKKAKLLSSDTIDIVSKIKKGNSWISCLENKKVLVIHPFAKTIEKQYAKRQNLFKNPNFLPEFELKTIKAVQGLDNKVSNEYKSWWDALEKMYQEIEQTDFDIAIIGAGAFGIFLANKVKECGKQAIQLCGATQILFGIKGERYNSAKIYNEYWCSPSSEETPENLSQFIIGESNKAYW